MKLFARVASLLLSAALFTASAGATAFAAETPKANTIVRYYSQLDDNQKALYNALKALPGPPEGGEVTIDLPAPVVYHSDRTGDSKAVDRQMSQIGQGALDALLFDHPEILWIDKSGCTSTSDAQGESEDGERFTWTIDSFTLRLGVTPGAAAMKRQMDAALFDAVGETRYDKVRYLHDKLCEMVAFEETAQSHNPYGALVEGKAVCEGYAKAFKLLCDRAGIPCVLAAGRGVTSKTGEEGENHMWNYVKMDDGKWYAVDATWADQDGVIADDFFLVGAETLSGPRFGETAFLDSHREDGDFSRTGIVFRYPKISKTRYQP